MFLLDTDTSIHFMKGRPEVLAHFAKHGPGTVFLSAISYHELVYGALHPAAVQRHLRVMAEFIIPLTVLPFTLTSAAHSSQVRRELAVAGQTIGPLDTLIAGHALEHEQTLVTGNAGDCPLVFKGGTLPSEAYVTFNRLSEDLDFTLPTGPSITRSERNRRAKEIATRVGNASGEFRLEIGGWHSFNNSTQHQVTLKYASVFGGAGTIKLEVGQREKPILPVQRVGLSILLPDPLFNGTAIDPVLATALTAMEACAEKVRAPLTRRTPAPRNLYELHHAVTSGVLDWRDEAFLTLAVVKLANEPDSDWLSEARILAFRRGLEPELRPVLRVDNQRSKTSACAASFLAQRSIPLRISPGF